MRKRYKAFTLAEMLVVMGIIVLFIAMAVPAIRALTGSSSISSTRNQLASLVTRAREEAVGLQDVRGVLFFVDPATDRVTGIICQGAAIQDSTLPSIIMLDALPGKDSLQLPTGIRIQTMFNGTNPSGGGSEAGSDDRYLGFNPLNTAAPTPPYVGGCILFDGNGKLIVRQYGFQMNQPAPGGSGTVASNLLTMLSAAYPTATLSSGATTNGISSAWIPGTVSTPIFSQLGLVIFDYEQFRSQGFTDLDPDMNGNKGYSTGGWTVGAVTQAQPESLEEKWIDTNSTPVLINRFNGTLIKGE